MTEQSKRDSDSKHTTLRNRRASNELIFDPETQTTHIETKQNIRASGDEFIIDPDSDTFKIKNDRKNRGSCCKCSFISISPKKSAVFILFIVVMLLVYIYQNELGFTQVIEAIQRKTLSEAERVAQFDQIRQFTDSDEQAWTIHANAQKFFSDLKVSGRVSRICGSAEATKYKIYAITATAKRVIIDWDGTAASTRSKQPLSPQQIAVWTAATFEGPPGCGRCEKTEMTNKNHWQVDCWNLELNHFALEYWNDGRADVRFCTNSGAKYWDKPQVQKEWQDELRSVIKERSRTHFNIELPFAKQIYFSSGSKVIEDIFSDVPKAEMYERTVAIDDDPLNYGFDAGDTRHDRCEFDLESKRKELVALRAKLDQYMTYLEDHEPREFGLKAELAESSQKGSYFVWNQAVHYPLDEEERRGEAGCGFVVL